MGTASPSLLVERLPRAREGTGEERLDEATRQIRGAVNDVDDLVAAARKPSIPSARGAGQDADERHDEPNARDT